MIDNVDEAPKKDHVFVLNVPANMTCVYQPLDFTFNGQAKKFIRNIFNSWQSNHVTMQ